MLLLHRLLALPPPLLGLILGQVHSSVADELTWPYNLPPHMKYYPEDEVLVKRNLHIQQKLQQHAPIGMRKMSGDPGEKFFLDYWEFEKDDVDNRLYDNTSIPIEFEPPLQLHRRSLYSNPILPRFLAARLFDKRDYQCPSDSYACTSIGRSDSCCANGSTCQIVQDVGLGDVGCCPENQVCGGSVSTCPDGGYSSCPQNAGGGCCLPGYACQGVGCIAVSTAVVVVTPTPSTRSTTTSTSTPTPTPTSSSSTSSTSAGTTVIIVPPPPSTTSSPEPTTSSVTPPPSTSTLPNTLICSPGFRSCPASLGGGCCQTDRACGRDVCPELSSTNSFTAPARPTSNSASSTSTTTTAPSSVPGAGCPTGFYACNAFYQGGCCQTGRNCDTTSCPPGGSITVVDGSSITAIAPTGSGVSSVPTLLTGSCANGWSTCAASVGGGCCPSGYSCGAACTATASGGQIDTVGKIAPNDGGKRKDSSLALIMVAVALWCMASM